MDENKQQLNHKKNKIGTAIACTLIILGVAILAGIAIRKNLQKQADGTLADKVTQTIAVDETVRETEAVIQTVPQKIDFEALWEINTDAYAFIEIPDTQVYYPILQSTTQEEDYYLNVTIEGTWGLPGSVYTQMVNAKDFSDSMTIIYGHDMLDGSYFGELGYYKDREFFEAHPYIYIYLPERQLQYQIIAEVVFDDRLLPANYDVKDGESMLAFIRDCEATGEAQNQFVEDMSVETEDKLIILSTCIGDRPNNRRLIIAWLVEEYPTEAFE